jgi:membrane protease YdiL (CAAX protease family)
MPAELGAVGSAFLYSVPPLSAAIVMLLVDWRLGGTALLRRLGLSLRRIPSGLFTGGLAAIVILPATYAIVIFEEPIYRRMNFTHPQEHDLLKLVGESPDHPIARVILTMSAIFIAPLVEEIFFRGHLQTFLQRLLIAISRPDQLSHSPGLQGFLIIQGGELPVPVTPPAADAAAPLANVASKLDGRSERVIDYAAPPLPTVVFKPVWQTWAAILLTSAVFASAHPRWMWPAIFFLAIGLGYCYERTGNLWANITIHSLFNALSTAVFLLQPHS